MDERASWRAPELGERREVQTRIGPLGVFEAGEGPPVVFVHGLLVNANLWRKVVEPLNADGLRTLVLDLPLGSHPRPAPGDADLAPPTVAAAVADALEALELEDVTLVGNDTGGALSQMLVTSRPERVGRLALTSCDYRDNFPPRLFSYFKVLGRFPALIPAVLAPLRLRPARRLPIAYGWLAKRPIDPLAEDSYILPALRDAGVRRDVVKLIRGVDPRDTRRAADLLGGFSGPALVAWSAQDKVFPRSHAEALAAVLGGARLEWIEDSYTFSAEDNPARLAELIGGFVREEVPA
jgi:pimeloyl-ACP methyl ester carboxylesterase